MAVTGAALLALCALAAACAAATPTRPPAALEQGLPFRELPPQRLASGECAMVLWTREPEPQRILHVTLNPPRARGLTNDALFTDFERTSVAGAPVLGFHPTQVFTAFGSFLTLELTIVVRERLEAGALVESGALTFRSHRGWTVVAPVVGIIGCQA